MLEEINKKGFRFFKECAQYNIPLWQCPSFLFFILGIFNIAAMVSTYFISNYYMDQPEVTALLTIAISLIILIIGSTVVRGFDRLLETNKMKTEFIRIASHQLRTPLSSLRWSLDILMKGDIRPSEEQLEYLNIIKESNFRMLKLINDLLDCTKIEMGNMPIKTQPVNMKTVIEEVQKEMAPLAKASNILVNLQIAENLPFVLADPDKIKMVVTNLLDNAVKYTTGGGKVEIRANRAGESVQVEFQDSGVGIPAAQHKNIFQKFFRSDNAVRHQTVGTGLGLFIVKAIIDANHGQIWFKSEENKGTIFYFKIPIAK